MAKPLLPWAKVRGQIAQVEGAARTRTLGRHEGTLRAFLRAMRQAVREVQASGNEDAGAYGYLQGSNLTDRPTRYGMRTLLRITFMQPFDDEPRVKVYRERDILVQLYLADDRPRGIVWIDDTENRGGFCILRKFD